MIKLPFFQDTLPAYGAIAKINAHDSFQNMMTDPDLHAVIIATPDKYHISYATEALFSGKHVFIEKPLCTTIEEGRQLLDQATKTNCVVAVGYHLRWHPGLRLLAEKVHSDGFGKIHHISINWAHTFIKEASWRNSPELSR
jgi:predicted dehydrogenase